MDMQIFENGLIIAYLDLTLQNMSLSPSAMSCG